MLGGVSSAWYLIGEVIACNCTPVGWFVGLCCLLSDLLAASHACKVGVIAKVLSYMYIYHSFFSRKPWPTALSLL